METETPAAEFLLLSHMLAEGKKYLFLKCISAGTVFCMQCDIQDTISAMQVLYLWFPLVLEI